METKSIVIIGVVIGLLIGAVASYVATTPQISGLQTQVSSLQTQIANLEQQVTTLQIDKTNLQNQINSLTQDKTTLQSQITNLIQENTNLQIQIEELTANKTSLQNQVQTLQTQVQQLQDENTRLKQEQENMTLKNNIPQGFAVLSTNTYVDSIGYFNLVGEITYNLLNNISFVKISTVFFDASGNLLGTDTSFTALGILSKGDITPFRCSIKEGYKVSTYVYIISYTNTTDAPYRAFTVSGVVTYIDLFGYFILGGNVNNTGTSQATSVNAIVTFYDSQQKILNFYTAYVTPSTLDPNQIGIFLARLDSSMAPKCTSYKIVIEP